MELYNLPFIQRGIETDAGRKAMADRFVKVHQRYGHLKAGNIMLALASAIASLNGKLGRVEDDSDEQRELELKRDQIKDLAFRFDRAVMYANAEYGFVHLLYRVKIDRALGVSKRLSSLRAVINEVSGSWSQFNDCINWLDTHTGGIAKCDHCEAYEYRERRRGALDSDMGDIEICRLCADNSFRHVSRYNRFVYGDDFRTARDRDGSTTYIHSEDEDFTYHDDHDFWAHVDYEPPPPPVIGRYHESKAHQRIIVDEWSKLRHRWFGVELEVEIKDHQVDKEVKARQLNELINGGDRGKLVFFESDGSLSNGFEIISQPMSLPAHHDLWNWLRDRDAVRHLLSHNTRTCGLHVHVNKDGLSQIQIAKVVTFVNDPRNEQMIRAIARRYAEGYCKIKQKDLTTAHMSSDRYEAVNVSGRNTIEFRIFKGSLKYESVIAAIEFCNSLCNFASLSSTNDVASLTGDNFIDFINNDGAAESTTLRPYMNAVLQTA